MASKPHSVPVQGTDYYGTPQGPNHVDPYTYHGSQGTLQPVWELPPPQGGGGYYDIISNRSPRSSQRMVDFMRGNDALRVSMSL
jgi:hypothetical protein